MSASPQSPVSSKRNIPAHNPPVVWVMAETMPARAADGQCGCKPELGASRGRVATVSRGSRRQLSPRTFPLIPMPSKYH